MYNSAHHHHNKPVVAAPSPESALAADVFEQLCTASTFKSVLHHYRHLCDVLKLKPTNIRHFYPKLKSKLRSWKAQALWGKFDKRASHKCYNHGKSCPNSKILIIGAGPCGLRTAIEAQLLGAKVVVVEKRDRFSRNNVLHLWPFVINDLKQLGAKKFYGKFCAGAIDHISIRQLQCILLKVALLLGVEVIENVSFEELVEPPEDQTEKIGWRARLTPQDHPANNYEFDVLIGADGKRNTLPGFRRKEFRGKLAIAITANFINKRSEAEARVQEISGVAFIFNQKFFKELYAATGIDLENIVYYKDETHYFVMTAKKHSLIDKGVIIRDLPDTQQLLHPSNVDRNALLDYAREAADFSTSYQLPHLDFAVNHYGKPDVAMFDFTSMFAAENACRMIERRGHKLLAGLVGDSLLEPFWPTGSGCARGFLSSFDAAWMVRTFATEKATPLEVLAERESIYRLLAQTTPENLGKDHSSYTIEPVSRYPTINLRSVLPFQVRSLYDTDDLKHLEEITNPHLISNDDFPKKRKRRDSFIHPDTLLVWCKKQVALYDSIRIENMTTSFKDGRVLCAIIHHYRPDLIEFGALRGETVAENNQMAFDILEREFGVPPVMTGAEMAECDVPDKLSMISYVSQIFDVFRGEIPHYKYPKMDDGEMEVDKIAPSAPSSTPHLNILKNLTNKTANTPQGTLTSKKRQTERVIPKREDGLITCHVLEDAGVITGDRKTESLKKSKKRRSEKVITPMEDEIESRQRREEILANRIERLRKQKEKRELDNVRFIRAMQMMQCGVNTPLASSFSQSEDTGLTEYRKNCVRSMREKAQDLERKLFYCPETAGYGETMKPQIDSSADFNDKVKDLEAKFIGTSHHPSDKKPKDLIRRIGKIEKTDWNIAAIEKKLHENTHGADIHLEREKVPKWSKDVYEDKFHNIEKRLRENGEDEETIAKYKDIDASLKRLEMKLREGSTLETGMRGQNKVSNLASQLSSKLEKKEIEKVLVTKPMRPTVPLPTSGSDLCHFCGNRVYLVERLSAEGKFFHRQCFKCDYCAANLRLGNYIYDRDGRYGGKFFCIPHYGLSPRERGLRRKTEDTDSAKENIVPTSTSTPPSSHLHMRNGPHTWPICGHEFLDWMQPSDGEISPRQYTALIRRASSLHYRPDHFLADHTGGSLAKNLEYGCANLTQTGDTLKQKDSFDKTVYKTGNTHVIRESCIDGHLLTLTNKTTESNYDKKDLSGSLFIRDKYPVCNAELRNNAILSSEFDKMKISSGSKNCNIEMRQNFYLHIARGTHLSESSDFKLDDVTNDKKIEYSGLDTTKQVPQRNGTVKLEAVRDVHQCNCDYSKALSLTDFTRSIKTYHIARAPILESISSSNKLLAPPVVTERPYYDGGYDTDHDLTPPHSSSECDDGKLKLILDSSPVWSRYLAWLQRMTKAQ